MTLEGGPPTGRPPRRGLAQAGSVRDDGRRAVVGVMGGGTADERVLEMAEELGRLIAERGWVLLNGGRDAGVMAASAKGADEAGGLVVGVLPGADRTGATPHLGVAIVTGLGMARNAVNVLSSDVVIALPGGAGTLSEIALARKAGRPLVLLGWAQAAAATGPADLATDDPDEALEFAARRFCGADPSAPR